MTEPMPRAPAGRRSRRARRSGLHLAAHSGRLGAMHILRRERFLVLRALRLVAALLERAPMSKAHAERLLAFLQGFAIEHHLRRAGELVAQWEAQGGRTASARGAETLEAERLLAADLVARAQDLAAADPPGLATHLEKLVGHLSQTLLKGDDTLDAILATFERGEAPPGAADEVGVDAAEDVEGEYREQLLSLEGELGLAPG